MSDSWYRLAVWVLRKVGLRALVSLLLLAMILGTISSGLNRIVRDLQIQTLTAMTLVALFFAWVLARSHLKGWQAGIAATIAGMAINFLGSGQLNQAILGLTRAAGRLVNELVYWRIEGPAPDLDLILLSMNDLGRQFGATFYRLLVWIAALLGRSPAYDRLSVGLLWGLVLWGIAAWAAWAVRRREQPLLGIVPATALFAANLAYSRTSPTYLLPVLAGAFLLMAWVHFNNRQRAWLDKGADYAEDIYFDLSLWILAFTLGISSFALMASYVSPQAILKFTQQLVQTRSQQSELVGESLGLESNPARGKGVSGKRSGSLPRQHLLGSGPELSRELVMSVQIERPLPEADTSNPAPSRYYWRALTYDIYTGSGWATSETLIQDYPAHSALQPSGAITTQFLRQTFHPLAGQGDQIYYSGVLVSVDQDFRIERRTNPPEAPDIFAATLTTHRDDRSYTVQSLPPQAGKIQLHAATDDYPQWVSRRYLQLPDTIPERVHELALGLTADAADPYAKASAIESYLRTITYTLDVPAPPPGQDVADYFLFDLRAGYCDYYATSMVVMARAVGLPARLVVGYAQGIYNQTSNSYIVSQAEAHSWTEVYFPGIGWVEFEPTGGRPSIDRPQDLSLPESPPPEGPSQEQGNFRPVWLSWLGWSLGLLACLALSGLVWQLGETWRLHRLPARVAVTRLYRNLYQQGKRLETVAPPGATPHEFVEALGRQIESLRAPTGWQKNLNDIQPEAHILADLYNRTIYSTRLPSKVEKGQAILAWGRLRLRLWLARWLKFSLRRSHQS